jgi:predicted DNA-binding WGR domain protein
MRTRSLRYTDAKSDKFWSIQWSGCSHTVQYECTGKAGQTQTKEFPTEAAAQKSYEQLVAEKLKKGYVDAATELLETVSSQSSSDHVKPSVLTAIPENWRSLALAEIQTQLVQNKKQLCELAVIDAIPDE